MNAPLKSGRNEAECLFDELVAHQTEIRQSVADLADEMELIAITGDENTKEVDLEMLARCRWILRMIVKSIDEYNANQSKEV